MSDHQNPFEKLGTIDLKNKSTFKRNLFKKLEERKQHRRKSFIYKSLVSTLSFLLVITIAFNYSGTNDRVFIAKVNDILALKISNDLNVQQKLYRSEIILPDGVYFYSESLPEIAELRKLNIRSEDISHKNYLSIALLAGTAGSKTVEVIHYGLNNEVLEVEKKKLFFHNK